MRGHTSLHCLLPLSTGGSHSSSVVCTTHSNWACETCDQARRAVIYINQADTDSIMCTALALFNGILPVNVVKALQL